MGWTDWLAAYGALLATCLAVVEIVRWLERRRGKIRVVVRDFFGRDSDGQPTMGEWVCFEAVNDGEKPVKITGLAVGVGNHDIDLTPCSHGTRNLRMISEGDDFSRLMLRDELLHTIGTETGEKPPYECEAVFHSMLGRRWRKRFTLDSQGVHA